MYIPNFQNLVAAGLALTGMSGSFKRESLGSCHFLLIPGFFPFHSEGNVLHTHLFSNLWLARHIADQGNALAALPSLLLTLAPIADLPASKIAHGSITDYAVEKCLDKDGTQRCTKPFLVAKSTCYTIKWSTDGALSHTTAEFRDAGSNEIVYYRDTDGDWTPEKGEVSSSSRFAFLQTVADERGQG